MVRPTDQETTAIQKERWLVPDFLKVTRYLMSHKGKRGGTRVSQQTEGVRARWKQSLFYGLYRNRQGKQA